MIDDMIDDAIHAVYGILIAVSIAGVWMLRPRTTRARRIRLVLSLALLLGLAGLGAVLWMADQPGPTDFASGRAVELAEYPGSSPTGAPPELAAAPLVARGEYLALAADCKACHTARGGQPFAGGRAFELPFGTLYTPNITPDPKTGIGAWSDAEFLRAMHQGIGRDGKRLYPAFPYDSYTLLTDEDVLAIKAYLFTLKPVVNADRDNTFIFPFNQRWSMAIWSLLFNPDHRFRPVAEQSPQWNRGAYLVEAAAHCGECHTPRNLMQAMDTRRKFAGGQAEGWNAYNITSDADSGIGAWSGDQLAAYLSHAHGDGVGTACGPMAEAVELSLSHLAPGDIQAMVIYLRTIPAVHDRTLPRVAGMTSSLASAGPPDNLAGKRIFEGACTGCHAWDGSGVIRSVAQLTGARAVNDSTGLNAAQMILAGADETTLRPLMPGFAGGYSDAEIAAVSNYVTERFGSSRSNLTPSDVSRLRGSVE